MGERNVLMEERDKPIRTQTMPRETISYICRWDECDKKCKTAAGRLQRERRMHRANNSENWYA